MSFIKIIISFFFIVLPTLSSASEFTLTEINEQEYVLSSPNDDSAKVIADRQASRDLELLAVLHVKCLDSNYRVPVLRGFFESKISSAEYLEFFIYEFINNQYLPIKSITSLKVTSDEISKEHNLNSSSQSIPYDFCEYINTKSKFENSIIFFTEENNK